VEIIEMTSMACRTAAVSAEGVQTPARTSRRPRVLVIDDDETGSPTFVRLLRLHGFDADFVVTAADALSHGLNEPPEAVLLDLHLANDDIPGFLVLKSLRARHPHLPIVVMTGWYLSGDHEAEARALGVSDYLFKPVDDSEIAVCLRRAIAARVERAERQMEIVAGRSQGSGTTDDEHRAADENDGSGSELRAVENAFISNRLRYLVRRIRRAFPAVWEDVIIEQVEDALMEFLTKLKCGIWPVRKSVDAHLRLAAWRNVCDQVQAATRRAAVEARYASEMTRNRQASAAESVDILDAVLALARTESERQAVHCWVRDRGSRSVAEALGVSHLAPGEQLREIKRFKDRLKMRFRRASCFHDRRMRRK
jgi:FixJ family two-component response regulator